MSTGVAWTSTVLIKGKKIHTLSLRSSHGCQNSGIQKVIVQSDGEPASEVAMRMVQSKGAMMENPPCEIIQQQSQRYGHQSNGGAERMVQTISDQSLQDPKLGTTQESPSTSTVLCSLGYPDTQHGHTRDCTNDKTLQEQHRSRFDTCLTKTQSYSSKRQLRADDQDHWSNNWDQHGSRSFGSDVTAKQMST